MKDRPAFPAFLLVATFIVSICLLFNPRWETNDDVAMSMVAHGYGLAAYGSPHLVFSNVLWGYLVRAIPAINGVLGYSVATLAILLGIGWAMLYFLLRLGAGYLTGLFAVALLVARPALFPQFTMNAGLLTVAAVIGWQVYARLGGGGNLLVACLLAFLGYLIRDTEFLLVLGVALPLLPWRALRERRQMQIAFLLLGAAIASASVFDRWSYSGQEWQHFWEFNSARIPFNDYGVGEQLKQRPEILDRHGYSSNDVNLISAGFFVDPRIADPKSINAMLAELGSLPIQKKDIQSGFDAIKALGTPVLLPLFLSALLLFVWMPRWPVALAWMLCMVALFVMGFMGRPGILRVYVPLVSLLTIAPFVVLKYGESARKWGATLTLFVACVGNAYLLLPEARVSRQQIQQVQRDLKDFPAGYIVSWANTFPYQWAFPVLASDLNSRNIKFYGLDSFTQAPFSVANTEQKAGRGMLDRLRTASGIPVVAPQQRLELLSIYCGERLNGQLRGVIAYQTLWLTVRRIRCERAE